MFHMTSNKRVLDAADSLDAMVGAYARALKKWDGNRRYEAPLEAFCLLKLSARYAESVYSLARQDLDLLPAAQVVTRALLEAGCKAIWLLQPKDVFEREARWAARLLEGAKHYQKLASAKSPNSVMSKHYQELANAHRSFAEQLKELLLKEKVAIPEYPSFWKVAKNSSIRETYPLYCFLSAYTHAGFAALDDYRWGLGRAKKFGDFAKPACWLGPIQSSGIVFFCAAEMFLADVDVDVNKHFPRSLLEELKKRTSTGSNE
jgi:hypothetical protein